VGIHLSDNFLLMNESIHKQTRSVRDVVYEAIKEGILSEQFTPNMQLKERDLSEQFGVSTTPIKEALRMLELEGLVFTRPRKGTYVSSQIMKSVEEITFVRSALEGVAARLAALKVTEKELAEFEEIIEQIKVFTREKDSQKVIENNEIFHQMIIKAAKNDYIERQTMAVKTFANVVRKQALTDADELERAFEEHYLIFKKIASNDPDGAEETIRNHIRRTVLFVKEKNIKL
jgi:DNA-binding GntR family transcriptional regulator